MCYKNVQEDHEWLWRATNVNSKWSFYDLGFDDYKMVEYSCNWLAWSFHTSWSIRNFMPLAPMGCFVDHKSFHYMSIERWFCNQNAHDHSSQTSLTLSKYGSFSCTSIQANSFCLGFKTFYVYVPLMKILFYYKHFMIIHQVVFLLE